MKTTLCTISHWKHLMVASIVCMFFIAIIPTTATACTCSNGTITTNNCSYEWIAVCSGSSCTCTNHEGGYGLKQPRSNN